MTDSTKDQSEQLSEIDRLEQIIEFAQDEPTDRSEWAKWHSWREKFRRWPVLHRTLYEASTEAERRKNLPVWSPESDIENLITIGLERCGVPPRYLQLGNGSFEFYDHSRKGAMSQSTVEQVKNWRGLSDDTILTLTGSAGGGKTMLAVARMRTAAVERCPSMRFYSVTQLLADERSAMKLNSYEPTPVEICRDVSLLVLDDLGAEKTTEWAAEQLYLVIGSRYNDLKPTIVTTNLSLGKVAEILDDRLASRMGGGLVVRTGTTDQRMAGG
jgi:DNA replication protein DnaC